MGGWHEAAKSLLERRLAAAGVRLDGGRPWDIQTHRPRFVRRVLWGGSLAFGESYMAGDWEAADLEELFFRLLRAGLERRPAFSPGALWRGLRASLFNAQTPRRAGHVGRRHYDLGNELFAAMLDRRRVYSCGYWRDADDLEAAQEAKLDLICRKLGLQPGMRLLDIGCGFGSLLFYAAERYGVIGHGITVSRRQAEWAREHNSGLPVTIEIRDYRSLPAASYDRVVSVGMVEHVGWRNYRAFMNTAAERLAAGGLFLLHTIGSNTSVRQTDPWIAKYIFPNSNLPSLAQLARAAENLLLLDDLHSFGPDYTLTLRAWYRRFTAAWPKLSAIYDETFRRMWSYYLQISAAAFRAGHIQLWQLLFSKAPRNVIAETVR